MPRAYNEGVILCPFYVASTEKSITCEGITDRCVNRILFSTSADLALHRKTFCDSKYHNCEVCRMLEAKYEEE